MFGRSKRFIKYRVCPLFLCVVLFSFTIPFVSAADYSGQGHLELYHNLTSSYEQWTSTDMHTGTLPFANVIGQLGTGTYGSGATGQYKLWARVGDDNTPFSANVTVYLSGFAYFGSDNSSYSIGDHLDNNPFYAYYVDANTEDVTYLNSTEIRLQEYTPDFPNFNRPVFPGFVLSATFPATEGSPIKFPSFMGNQGLYYWAQNSSSSSNSPVMRIVSFRAITTDTSAELEGLEAIADSIVAQSDMMSAFYGDIVAICNQIYSRLGDMHATAELANVYFQQMIELLKSIDSTTVDIYNLLGTQFELLIQAVNSASSDIQAAISSQTAALIAYFDSVFSGAVGSLPEKSEDLETNIGNVGTAENEYKSNASSTFEQLSAEFTGFTGGTLSGIALASNLFTQVWNALGEYSVVYSFPLLFGLCLLLIGRLSKHSGGQSSTDKERGDSDA